MAASSRRFRPSPPERQLAASGSLDRSRLLHSPEPPRVLPRQETRTAPILTEKHGMFPRRGESHVLPASQKGPMMPRRPRCLNTERSQETLKAAQPPFTPHTPVPVCSALTPRQLRPSGVTENVFSVESIEGVQCSTPEPAESARFRNTRREAREGAQLLATSPRGRGIGHDIDPWSASHSKPSWEPTVQVGVRVNAERRADRFKTEYDVVPAMPNEHIPRYYASSGMDGFEESSADFEGQDVYRSEDDGKTGQEWIEDATRHAAHTQFTRPRAGFNLPGSSDDAFRVARARQVFYNELRDLGPCHSERGFAMVQTPPLPRPGAMSQRPSQMFKLSGGISVASEESIAGAAPDPPGLTPKTSSDWRNFKKTLHAHRQPKAMTQWRRAEEGQWPPRESITFRSCIERGLLPVAGNEPANVNSALPRDTIIARQARQY
jgi:hypothetical protein